MKCITAYNSCLPCLLYIQLIHFYRFLLNDFKSFNPLFKVLFIFPSQYLFAIGFPQIFSLRRSLSPIQGCNPKQPDSKRLDIRFSERRIRGFHPLWRSIPRDLFFHPTFYHTLQITIRRSKTPDFKFELLPVRSPLLRQSQLISFPPLTDMLKFSGQPCLISDTY